MKKNLVIVLFLAGAGASLLIFLARRNPSNEYPGGTLPRVRNEQTPKPQNLRPGTATNPILLTNFPEHIQTLLEQSSYDLDWSVARKLTPADKNILLQLYRNEPTIVKKRGLTMALGFIGDEEVVEVFKYALSDQYAGRKLTAGNGDSESNEEIVMNRTVEALGFLANRSDSAFELMKKGFDPKFWKDYCKFIPATGVEFYGVMTSRSIQAIGWSGRADVTNVLESLKSQPLVNSLDTSQMQMSFHTALVSAAFSNDVVIQDGIERYKYFYLTLHALLQRMTEWEKQANGLEWSKWCDQKEGVSLLP